MPQVKFTDKKGLHQVAGGGIQITGGQMNSKRNVIALTDAAADSAIRVPLTIAESGAIITVPAMTVDNQTLVLPVLTASTVGCTYTFVMVGTAAQTLTISTPGAEKILGVLPKGDGDNMAAGAAFDTLTVAATALMSTSWTLTCISATAGVAWLCHGVQDGVAANTLSLALA